MEWKTVVGCWRSNRNKSSMQYMFATLQICFNGENFTCLIKIKRYICPQTTQKSLEKTKYAKCVNVTRKCFISSEPRKQGKNVQAL